MRRYLPTLLILFLLLAAGGWAIYRYFGEPVTSRGAYVPTLNTDSPSAQTLALIFVGGVALTLFMVVGMGVTLAIAFNQFTKLQARMAQPSPAETARPAPKAPAPAPQVPLSNDRSLIIFWIVVLLIAAAFLVINYWGQSASPLPSLTAPLFRLPGEHIEGLPPFIAGPGDNVTALHLFIAVLGGVIVTTIIAGIGLARGWARLDQQVKEADKAPRTPVDRTLAFAEARIRDLLTPKPRRPPANSFDRVLLSLDMLLLLIVAGIVAVYVVPSFGAVAAVDQAVEATHIASRATPTPALPSGPSALELLQEEFAALPPGDAAAGQATFTAAGCVACHSLQPGVTLIGPSQSDVGTRAATRKPGYPPEIYLYESIIHPNTYIVQGFQPGLMPQTFKQTLTPQDLSNLVAFLLTLK